MKYNVTLGKSKRTFEIDTPIDLDGVVLMVADSYGDEWYGCCVSCPSRNSFYVNAVESYYTGKNEDGSDDPYYSFPEECKNRTVHEWAILRYCDHLKYANGHFDSWEDYNGDTTYKIKENIFEGNGVQ